MYRQRSLSARRPASLVGEPRRAGTASRRIERASHRGPEIGLM
jgi:hypothetical protein